MNAEELKRRLKKLFSGQRLAVLSTHDGGRPYASLVAFAATEDLRSILFATTRSTRKFTYLTADAHAAMLIDNRSNRTKDFHDALAVTALGKAVEVKAADRPPMEKLYIAKHPHLETFLFSQNCALLEFRIERYILVSRFQNVFELEISR